jgi:hypothetical protein
VAKPGMSLVLQGLERMAYFSLPGVLSEGRLLSRSKERLKFIQLGAFIMALFVSGIGACTANPVNLSDSNDIVTPTLHPFFAQFNYTSTPQQLVTPQVFAPSTPIPSPPLVSQPRFITQTIFGDGFDVNWQYYEVANVKANLANTTYVYSGRNAIALTPLDDFSPMYFVVRKDAEEIYAQDQVFSITFWLNSGDNVLLPDDLAITVLGSNDFPYWVEDDQSVYVDGEFPFSETRLYFLGFNSSIPPDTWVEVEIVLDDLIYDPVYTYVTGFYLKNDEGFYNTIYMDDIRIILFAPEPSSEPAQTPD